MSFPQYCEERKNSGHFYQGHRCANKALFKRDGKWYCGTHDPVMRIAIQNAEDVERDAQTRKLKLADEMVEVLRVVHEALETSDEVYSNDLVNDISDETFGQMVASILAKVDGEKS